MEKVEKVTKVAKRMKKVQKEAGCYNSKTLEWINEEKSCIRIKYKRTQ